MQKTEPLRTVKPTPLIAPTDLHVVDPNTKIAIRFKAGLERMVPPAFVGLSLAAGALPAAVYAQQDYGRYVLLDGSVHGEVAEAVDAGAIPMVEKVKDPEAPKRDEMVITEPPTQDEILAAIQVVK